jgi:hypothetical protein
MTNILRTLYAKVFGARAPVPAYDHEIEVALRNAGHIPASVTGTPSGRLYGKPTGYGRPVDPGYAASPRTRDYARLRRVDEQPRPQATSEDDGMSNLLLMEMLMQQPAATPASTSGFEPGGGTSLGGGASLGYTPDPVCTPTAQQDFAPAAQAECRIDAVPAYDPPSTPDIGSSMPDTGSYTPN